MLLLEVDVRSDAASVWTALVVDEHRREWWPHLAMRAELGGALLEEWQDEEGHRQRTRGEVVDLEPERRIRCSWQDDGWPAGTEVEIALVDRAGGTRVVLRHTGWRSLPDGRQLLKAHRMGWSMHLANLKSYVEEHAQR